MEPVVYRMGILAALISVKRGGRWVGVMITASHNPAHDNGVKLIDFDGQMLGEEWEGVAEEFAAMNEKELEERLRAERQDGGRVLVGRDTRPSGPGLAEMTRRGVEFANGKVFDIGLVTTPEMHVAVARLNTNQPKCLDPQQLERLYLDDLINAFGALVKEDSLEPLEITIDASNGVGAIKLQRMRESLRAFNIDLQIFNDRTTDLNHLCGADHVKVNNSEPAMLPHRKSWAHYASIDGDADRCIFFTFDEESRFVLLDGDRIGCLLAEVVSQLVVEAGLDLSIGIVQTAYANGAATAYLYDKSNKAKGNNPSGLEVVCTPTGVKYLHHAAKQFDIGIYSEANGHGTVLFRQEALSKCRSSPSKAAMHLLALAHLANQLVGDALSDLLLVEGVLHLAGKTIASWVSMYRELPSRQLKVNIKDRSYFKTTDADRRIVDPAGVQDKIDQAVKEVTAGRAFARPSGTENVVRVYAEAKTNNEATQLAKAVVKIIQEAI